MINGMSTKILVTGASGFIGAHCVLDLLLQGYAVRGTIRNLARADALTQMFAKQGADTSQLEFAAASLTEESGWATAVAGCDGVFHVASPVPTVQPKDPMAVIGPAKAGTLHVLNAAAQAGINRIVLTSSVAAVFGGISERRAYTPADWSDPDDPEMTPYAVSKTLAEKVAWEFCHQHQISLTTIQPALVLGPALEADYGSSLEALLKLLGNDVPLLPRFGFEIVDVRDVAALHRLAFENPEAVGQRLIAANGFLWFREIADILKAQYPERTIPHREMPNWLARIASLFVKEIGSFLNDLDVIKQLDITASKAIGWQPRSPKEAIISGAESLIQFDRV